MGGQQYRLHVRNMMKIMGESDRAVTIRVPEFTVNRGEFIVITGANGSGKSTFLDLLAKTLCPDNLDCYEIFVRNGERIDMRALTAKQTTAVRRHYFSYILQTGGLLEFLTIEQNIKLVQRLKGGTVIPIESIADELAIKDILNMRPSAVSGGQRQKGAIARALVQDADLLLADEPTSAMDKVSAHRLVQILKQRARMSDISVVMVSHDEDLVRTCADRVYQFEIVEPSEGGLIFELSERRQPIA